MILDEEICAFLATVCSQPDYKFQDQEMHIVKNVQMDDSYMTFKLNITVLHDAFTDYHTTKLTKRQIKQYIQTCPFLSRCNRHGDNHKTKGKRFYMVQARKSPHDEWIFKRFQPTLVFDTIDYAISEQSTVECLQKNGVFQAACTVATRFCLIPVVHHPHMKVKCQFQAAWLPHWLDWKDNRLMGIPNVDDEDCQLEIFGVLKTPTGEVPLRAAVHVSVTFHAYPGQLEQLLEDFLWMLFSGQETSDPQGKPILTGPLKGKDAAFQEIKVMPEPFKNAFVHYCNTTAQTLAPETIRQFVQQSRLLLHTRNGKYIKTRGTTAWICQRQGEMIIPDIPTLLCSQNQVRIQLGVPFCIEFKISDSHVIHPKPVFSLSFEPSWLRWEDHTLCGLVREPVDPTEIIVSCTYLDTMMNDVDLEAVLHFAMF
ncbi:hypothetical protein EDD86DRAFT_209769 [Gorgonomyces haynaldii]|nr:hypothetical protein EDD86DRAFT_209769 [Gorgonomyces haynaldii]